ncbi:hypothetical protein [Sphingomonas sp. UMB7805-LC452B]|nr:hypothetical protein [Sphingomonas sp. UMB7805-LC452B]MDK8217880.1 hypothetical protein [Sphingomonas sp. UMB7805-LC452B]
MEKYYVNDILPSLLKRRSAALPSWLLAAYDAGQIVISSTGSLIVAGAAVRGGDWIVRTADGVAAQIATPGAIPAGVK